MRNLSLFILFCLSQIYVLAQKDLSFKLTDTINFKYRSGQQLDSIDLLNANSISTLPGGGFNSIENTFSAGQFYLQTNLANFRNEQKITKNTFSAFPHLGFTYSFGTKAIQFFHVDYTQAFKRNSILNLEIKRNSSGDIQRNSDFKHSAIKGDFRHSAKFYSFHFSGLYASHIIGLNSGIDDLTDVEKLGITLSTVRNETANSKVQQGDLELTNYFNLLNDSLKGFGIYTRHHYTVHNRVYNETGFDIQNNQNIFVDSFTTRDQYQQAAISNTGGLYFSKKILEIKGGIKYKYWRYQNLGKYRDTSELNIEGNYIFKKNNFTSIGQVDFNILGAKNESKISGDISYSANKTIFSAQVDFKSILPEPYQRFYFANYYNYIFTVNQLDLQKQLHLKAKVHQNFSNNKFIAFQYEFLSLQDNYFFIDSTWRNDSLPLAIVHSLKLNGSFNYKILFFQPAFYFNFSNADFNFVPDYNLRMRLFLKSKVFKAKKLETYFGVDLSYISNYGLLTYNSSMDVYVPSQSNVGFKSQANISVFGGFGIDVFRMFFRVENLGYLFNDVKNMQAINYPIPPGSIRIGLTWDFFN